MIWEALGGWFVWCVLLSLVAYELWWHLDGKRRRWPAGPTPLPFLGNLLEVNFRYPERSFRRWSESFGPVFTFWLGPLPMVAVTGLEDLKRFGGHDFAGRAENFAVEFLAEGNRGVLNAQGPLWKEQRRFALSVLRDLGFGRNHMEPKITAQVQQLVRHLKEAAAESSERLVFLSYPLELAIGNVLCDVLIGRRYAVGDPDFWAMRELNRELFEMFTGPRIFLLICYPWLRHVPVPGRFGFTAMQEFKGRFWAFFHRMMEEYEARWPGPQGPQKDFAGAYLAELSRREEAGDVGFFGRGQLEVMLADFALAGMDTSRTTLEWAFLLLLRHPDVQDRCQAELDAFYGTDSPDPVSMAHRPSLPFTAATLMEIQRLTNVLPINLQHATRVPVRMGGKDLPAGTPVLAQISTVLSDPAHFPEPEAFDPLRFLEEGGTKVAKVEAWVPFGVGKRVCGGESLARMQLFLIFASLVRSFRFLPAPGRPPPSLKPQLKFTRTPQPYQCRVVPRHSF